MKFKDFQPDYHNIVDAARNIQPKRLPIYEHLISDDMMERIMGKSFSQLLGGDEKDINEYYRNYCEFFKLMGYDTVSFESCIMTIMPGNGCLMHQQDSAIKTRSDFEKYPWDEVVDIYKKISKPRLDALRANMPAGMKGIGGAGNGVFECIQDIIGYTALCYMKADDPELYADLFKKIGDISAEIWSWIIKEYDDVFCVYRFGDDLGFRSAPLIPARDIRNHVIPQYKRIIDMAHAAGKPFLYHSCGRIFEVMDDLIAAGIDAKHSNEDQIAPFYEWVKLYGDRIGNFGGPDLDVICRSSREEMKEYIYDIIHKCEGHGGFAFATGNSIPSYVPTENYINMIEIVREYRGER